MNIPQIIRDLCSDEPRPLELEEAYALFGAMLDDAVEDVQIGALMIALRAKGLAITELLGFAAALQERTHRLDQPQPDALPIVIPSYHGAHSQPNLMPLLALLLARLNLPVVVHGTLESYGGVSSAAIFRELGIYPCASLIEAQEGLERDRLALLPVSAVAPGLARLLRLRALLGVRALPHTMAKVLDPFAGNSVRMVPVYQPGECELMRQFIAQAGGRALVLRGTEGEAYADPHRRPKIEFVADGDCVSLFEAEHVQIESVPGLPQETDARSTAAWIQRVLAGQAPLPLPLANQLACCLYAAGKTASLNQAKAIAAIHASSRAAA